MLNNNFNAIPDSLRNFLLKTDTEYRQQLSTISLFNPAKTSQWDKKQIKQFAGIFYYLRGYFINFMWYIANFSTRVETKQLILDNMHEEIGPGSQFSHERLYARFAEECGINIHQEIISEEHYLPFAKEFNKSHLAWLTQHSEEEWIAAFAAYERLDNLDYPALLELAKSLKLSRGGLTFFNVHINVTHFDSTLDLIIPIWEKSPEKIIHSFEFIHAHQLTMWRNFSDILFAAQLSRCA